MKYSVSINEKKQTITVTLADGTQGVAKCCPTDKFDIGTGIELALDRAKNAQAARSKPSPSPSPMSVMELVRALEKALPKGKMVIVGNGVKMTAEQKEWLHSLTDCKCSCDCANCPEWDAVYDAAHEDGYNEGYSDGEAHKDAELVEAYDEGYNDAMAKVRGLIDELD